MGRASRRSCLHSSSTGGEGDDQSWGVKLSYPNDRVNWILGYTEIGDRFDAALGFVPRRGIREYFARWRYRWRPQHDVIRTIDTGINPMLITDLDDKIETTEIEIELIEIETNDGDTFGIEVQLNREVLDEQFEIQSGIVIPAGDYRFDRVEAIVETTESRPLSVVGILRAGEFFDGERLDAVAGFELRPSPNLFLSFSWEHNDVRLPGRSFEVQIAQGRIDLFFSPDLSWTNFIQWDSVSDSLGVNSRLRWIIEPGNELFLVVNQAFDTFDDRFDSTSTELTTKIGWTFRF